MNIEDILASLGLDLTNPEVKRGAVEAIEAILDSRQPPISMDAELGSILTGGETVDVDIDPDLIQPSKKHQPQSSNDDVEIEDEEDILSQVKHNDSEEEPPPAQNTTAGGEDSSAGKPSRADSSSSSGSGSGKNNDTADSEMTSTDDETTQEKPGTKTAEEEPGDEESEAGTASGASEEDEDATTDTEETSVDTASGDDSEELGDDELSTSALGAGADGAFGDNEEDEEEEFDLEDIPEDDLLDDETKQIFGDQEKQSKYDARKVKRERTLTAAKKALNTAKANKVAPRLIHELEQAIEALESLQEAVKHLRDVSDDEFDRLVNRVFDAMDAVGDKDLTFSSDEDRELRAKEIKADISSANTQAELGAEDIEQIRAETQAVKAREKEAEKYKTKSRSSFKGFSDFLNSITRAIALQVQTNEVNNDTWSAISRRNSGAGVLRQGKRKEELPDRKIPIIDFYFDQSGSWGRHDIEVGNRVVAALADMQEKGDIKINIYYFGNYVSTDPDQVGGGTSGWNEIVKNVITTKATNVVVMTDSDMEDWWSPSDQPPLRYTVPGYAWYLWRDGENAPRCPRDLKGRGGTLQFSFSSNEVV